MATRALAVLLVVLTAAQFTALFVAPFHEDDLVQADAVVVLAGDHGDRLSLGLRLVRAGAAPTLVVLNPGDGPVARSRPLCSEPQSFEVRCPTPLLVSTVGDVREIEAVAAAAGWRRVSS